MGNPRPLETAHRIHSTPEDSFVAALLRIWPSHQRLRGEVLPRVVEWTVLRGTSSTPKSFRLGRDWHVLWTNTFRRPILMFLVEGTKTNKPCVLSATLYLSSSFTCYKFPVVCTFKVPWYAYYLCDVLHPLENELRLLACSALLWELSQWQSL